MVCGAWIRARAVRIGIIAALPGELKQLVNLGFSKVSVSQLHATKWMMSMGEDVWIAVCAGIGADAVRRAFVEAEEDGALDMVLSIGWAGALTHKGVPGGVEIATCVIDAQTGERFELAGGERKLVLVSVAKVANLEEKRRLARAYGGSLVDMESATIVRLAEMRKIPVSCLKAESDGLDDDLPDFGPFIDRSGQMLMLLFIRYVIVRPRYWGPLIRLGRASSAGAHNMASVVFTLLTGPKNLDEVNRTGNVDW